MAIFGIGERGFVGCELELLRPAKLTRDPRNQLRRHSKSQIKPTTLQIHTRVP